MRVRLYTSMLAISALFLPAITQGQTIMNTLALFSAVLNSLIGIFITVAIVVFFWGLIKYLMKMGTDDAHQAIHLMIWGVVSIFVMVSIWGIIQLLQRTFGVDNNSRALLPAPVPMYRTTQ